MRVSWKPSFVIRKFFLWRDLRPIRLQAGTEQVCLWGGWLLFHAGFTVDKGILMHQKNANGPRRQVCYYSRLLTFRHATRPRPSRLGSSCLYSSVAHTPDATLVQVGVLLRQVVRVHVDLTALICAGTGSVLFGHLSLGKLLVEAPLSLGHNSLDEMPLQGFSAGRSTNDWDDSKKNNEKL